MNPKQYFTSLETMYKLRLNSFLQTANKHIYNRDYALDAVHDAFVKAQVYKNKHPDRNFREQILHVLIIRAARKINKKFSSEISSGLMNEMEA